MNILSADDYSDAFEALLLGLLDDFDGDEVTDEEIWEAAKQFDDAPHLGNVYLTVLCKHIESAVKKQADTDGITDEVKVTYYINSMDSHIYLNDERFYSKKDYETILEKVKGEQEALLED